MEAVSSAVFKNYVKTLAKVLIKKAHLDLYPYLCPVILSYTVLCK